MQFNAMQCSALWGVGGGGGGGGVKDITETIIMQAKK